jgi:hypothetical protein
MTKAFTSEIFQSTYRDDYRDSDNYHRVLFNSGRALQARELTQLQTIMQKELGRLGKHIFQEGAAVNPGGITVNTEYEFVKLDTTVNQLPATITDLVGVEFTSAGSISFRVLEVVPATLSDPDTLYITYTNTSSGTSGTVPIRVAAGDGLNGGEFTLTVQSTNTVTNPATGQGCRASIHGGDFFAKDHFVFASKQSKIISKYSNRPTVSLGFKVTEDIITSSDTNALFDNQGATPNLASPGADRYRIKLTIATGNEINSDENYIEIAKVVNGLITSQVTAVDNYNQIDNVLALRTKEESGDYIVKPFELLFETNDSDISSLDFILSSGTAYVDGYRAATTGDTIISVPKPRTTASANNQVVAANYGSYIVVSGKGGSKGIPDVNTFQEMNLRSVATYGGSTIGTARVRHVEEDGANYRLYLFNIQMNSGQNFADVKCIGDSATDFWNLVLENSKAVIKDAANGGLLFNLPTNRPQSISDISLTTQRRFSTQTNASGEATISLTATGETFSDTTLWTMGSADSDVDINVIVTGAGSQSANITNAALSQNPYEVLAYVNKSAGIVRTKTITERTQTITPDGSGNCTLDKADIYSFEVIKDTDSDGDSITTIYEIDNGQRDDYYDLGKINLIAGNSAPSSVYIKYKYFEHGAGGDFFAVNSYTGQVTYENIPSFTKSDGSVVNLRNVLDFRPVVNSSGDFGSGSKINELPRPTDLITFDVNYYQGQAAKVVITTDGKIRVVRGAAGIVPSLPKSPENSLDLFNVIMNPYVLDNNDISSEMLTYKRFTMADIGKMEQRISKLEEVTSLSLLELETSQFDVFDSAGLSRNKSGFFVDSFKDQYGSFVASADYKASIDPSRKQLRPMFTNRNTNLYYDSDNLGNSNVVIKGDNLYLSYNEVGYIENNFVTGVENVNPFSVVLRRGFLELSPTSDEWFETEYVEPIVVDGGFAQGNVNGRIWDDWSFNWSGAENISLGEVLGDTLTGATQQGNAVRTGNTTTTPQFRTDQSVKVEGLRTRTDWIDEEGVEVNRTFIPFMRTRKIFFRAQGLKPNTRHFPFFANKDVASWVKQESFRRISTLDSDYSTGYNDLTQHPNVPTATLLTNGEGKLEGSFFLPNNNNIKFQSGDRTLTLIDISVLNEDHCTSLASAKYYAQGVTIHRQQTILSTRLVDLVVTQNRVQLESLVQTDPPQNNVDPLAQSFIVEETSGVFITSISVRFKTKPVEGATPVIAQLRPIVNGVPSATSFVPGSTVFKSPDAIITSDDGTSITTFTFDEPVYLTGQEEYAIVLLTDSNEYNVYVAEAGEFLLGSTERRLTKQATLGSLFKSQNGRTWEPDQTKDLTFSLLRADFITSGSAIVENSSPPMINVSNNITTTASSATVRMRIQDHGFIIGDDFLIESASTVGGIAANNINGVRTVTAIDGDNLQFVAGTAATSSTTGGGSFRVERQNMFETMLIKVENILPPATNISVSGKLTSGKSLAGSETAYQKETTYKTYPVNRNIYLQTPKLLSTKRNADGNLGANVRSSTFKIDFATASSLVSPVVDIQRTSVSTIHNRIDKQVASGTGGNIPLSFVAETNARGGSSLAKHLTKPVTLAEKARGLKIMLSANKPSSCSFDVYYRTNNAGRLLDQEYVLIEPEASMPSDDNPTIYRDYRYLPGGIGGNLIDFDQFQVKIVMKSSNSSKVPKFGDLRVIALTV